MICLITQPIIPARLQYVFSNLLWAWMDTFLKQHPSYWNAKLLMILLHFIAFLCFVIQMSITTMKLNNLYKFTTDKNSLP